MNLSYMDDGGTEIRVFDDDGLAGLVKQLRKYKTMNIYLETLDIEQDKTLPEALFNHHVLLGQPTEAVELDMSQSSESSKEDEENLFIVPVMNLDVDDERATTVENVGRFA